MQENRSATVTDAASATRGIRAWCAQGKALMTAGLTLCVGEVMAQGLPTTAPPSRGAPAAGDYIGWMKEYAYDIFILLGLLIATVTFFVVAKNTLGAYGEVQDGRGTWGQFGMQCGVGVLLMVFVFFLLTEAAGVL